MPGACRELGRVIRDQAPLFDCERDGTVDRQGRIRMGRGHLRRQEPALPKCRAPVASSDGSYVINPLFSTVNETELSIVKGAFEWDADIYVDRSPPSRNAGPLSRARTGHT